jgi:hypothetical protein
MRGVIRNNANEPAESHHKIALFADNQSNNDLSHPIEYPTAGDWLILRSLRSKMCLSPRLFGTAFALTQFDLRYGFRSRMLGAWRAASVVRFGKKTFRA